MERLTVQAAAARMLPQAPRIALYGHDTQGLGHIRRNLCIADALAHSLPRPAVLVCAGVSEARSFALPPGTDLLTLPALRKDVDGGYGPRSLGDSVDDLLHLRAETLRAALGAFRPGVLVVDKAALGAMGELEPALRALRQVGTCRVVLGLRDILDAPATARREWTLSATTDAIRRYYDAVWVYGDREVADPVAEYALPADVAAKVSFSGYLSRGRAAGPPDAATRLILSGDAYALCLVGGGQDGVALARTFLDAPLPDGVRGVVVTGPFMEGHHQARLAEAASRRPDRELHTFVSEPMWLIRGATAVAAMAGYNTVCELLQSERPAVLVPRVRPRREQQIRAERLAAMGLVECLLPDALDAPALGAALARAPARAPITSVDLDGGSRLAGLCAQLLADRPLGGARVAG